MPVTVADALREAAAQLAATSDTARLDAELLMAHALGVSRSDLLLRHMQDTAPASYAALIARRAKHEPVAYILGEQEFFGLRLKVTEDVLIPRADSETVVQAACDAAPGAGRMLDLGTGSGALLLALLQAQPKAQGVGVDASAAALMVAQQNSARCGLGARAEFLERDWSVPDWTDELGQFDLIICNPPYVEEDADLDPGVRGFEPHSALFAGEDGLDDYRIVIPQLRGLLTQSGTAVLEIGAAQAEAVAKIAADHGFTTELRRDLANRPRALILR